ncbi:electron transport complex subunit RsxC [Thiohalomonas denitrificans]|uniref:Ion-translocating oxidoreductase complex subunit C n=1 Tax=Thiohalomonas denitrificans TaxID=415747 RepID=A0A1G5QMD3_9GAMM|nr:electron transport complex subunit RsxC [Thiohalomonas denitrificans]SCZ62806.1 electron transport complex protein RnfC [Thiohalomonas denitrificans]
MSRKLSNFPGGLHLPGHKELSAGEAVTAAEIPDVLVIPLHQHIGAAAEPLVEAGQTVRKGEVLAKAKGFVSAAVHASSSGTVIAIEDRPVAHPSGLPAPCIVLETDGEDTWCERRPVEDYRSLDPSELRNIIRDSGIVGLGGAGFPAYIKLNPGARTAVDTLILNGAECEPYITCDDMLMRERADEIIAGARIMRHALNAGECLVAIEDNKPEAIASLRETLERLGADDIEVVEVPTRYPMGGEKQLIKVITGKEVPSQGLPLDIGIVCHNVATASAIHRAVERGEPLISRIVTMSGGVGHPRNLEVRIGTPVEELLPQAGGLSGDVERLIVGGPMMGFTLQHRDAPVVKTVNCILAATREMDASHGPVRPCIRCGACSQACPVSLMPQQLYWYARAKDFDKVQDYNLFDCIECGCCAYVCPSNLPLVQFYRFAKTEIWSQEREKKAADLARDRYEFRTARIEREKAEKAARMAKKKAAVKGEKGKGDDAKKDAIKAAMERAKAKKEGAGTQPKNTEDLTEEQKRKLAEAKARREKMLKEQEQEQNGASGDKEEK